MNPETREKIQEINSKKLSYALKNFAIANTKNHEYKYQRHILKNAFYQH